MEPINYLAQVADPFAQATQGLKLGAGMADLQRQQEARAAQQQQAQLAAQEQARFFANPKPTMRDAARFASLLSPEQSKAFLPYMEGISKEQQQNTLKSTGQLLSALQVNPEVGIARLRESALAARNSGDKEDAALFEQYAEAAADPQRGPAVVFKALAARTAGIPGAKEFFENIDKSASTARAEAKAPAELTEAQAKAQSAAVAAKFAESNAVKDLERKGWDITKIQSDMAIARQNAQIAAMNAATSRESNAIKREENQLRLREMIDKRDTAVREKAAEVESARADMDNFLNTADRILATPKSVIGSAAGPVSARMPTLSQDTADFEALVETLGSQAFMSQIPKMKGAGALSEREGDKLQASLQNLSLKQSPERLIENVKESQRLILKARSTLSKRSGLPDTIPDTPAVQTNATDIDALLKKYGGTK
jgi:hypothetical protein